MDLHPANLPLALEACDAKALADLLGQRNGGALDVDGAHELLGSLIELRDAEAGVKVSNDQSGLLFRSTEIGGVVLYSPTIAARLRLQDLDKMEFPPEWLEYADEYVTLCVAWILAHGQDREALARWRPETAQAIVEMWSRQLTCTSHELSEVVADLTSNGYPPMIQEAASRKKALARPARHRCWLVWPKRFAAWIRNARSTAYLKRLCTGCATHLQRARERWKRETTPTDSAPTIPASTPENATSASGRD